MTIVVDISPETQAELERQAAAHGRALEAHAATMLEDAVHIPANTRSPAFDRERARAAGERIRELRKGVTLGGADDQGVDRRRPSVSRFVLDNTVTMAWCFADEATPFTENLLNRLSSLTDSAIVPALWL